MFCDLDSNGVPGSTNICNVRLNRLTHVSCTKYYGIHRKETLHLLGKGFLKVTFQGGEMAQENLRCPKGRNVQFA